MAIVLDANLLIVLVSGDSRRERVLAQMTQWLRQNTPLHAPHLLPYEVTNALTRAIAAGQFSGADLAAALAESLNAELWTLDSPLYRNAIGLGFPVQLIQGD